MSYTRVRWFVPVWISCGNWFFLLSVWEPDSKINPFLSFSVLSPRVQWSQPSHQAWGTISCHISNHRQNDNNLEERLQPSLPHLLPVRHKYRAVPPAWGLSLSAGSRSSLPAHQLPQWDRFRHGVLPLMLSHGERALDNAGEILRVVETSASTHLMDERYTSAGHQSLSSHTATVSSSIIDIFLLYLEITFFLFSGFIIGVGLHYNVWRRGGG